jgi:hypothetical protein
MIIDAVGCDLEFPVRETHASATPDYATQIAPIIAEQCATCHREGGIGPFAMDSHLMLQGWSPMIRETLITKRMPPTQVDPNIGHFNNARYMTDGDLQTLVHWIDAGAPRGESAIDPLTQIDLPNWKEWSLGEPDFIIKAPKMEIPATGVLDYIDVDVELPFDEDMWVKAVQFIPVTSQFFITFSLTLLRLPRILTVEKATQLRLHAVSSRVMPPERSTR